MPHTLLTAKHNRNLREAHYTQKFDVVEIWDLHEVEPLFNIPACTIFVAASAPPRPTDAKPGLLFSAKLPEKDVPLAVAKESLVIRKVRFELSFMARCAASTIPAGARQLDLPVSSRL